MVEVPEYDHLPGQGGCPALSTLQATQQSQKTGENLCTSHSMGTSGCFICRFVICYF